jgi:hypothetical protein
MDAAQVQPLTTRVPPMSMATALLKLLTQPTLKPLPGGKHTRSGITKNKFQGESKTRRKMAKESRRRNRA